MTHQDILQRFIFDGAPVRGALVRLDAAWQQVLARRSYPAPLERLLGEMMAASSLLSANLKFEGTLVMQLQGQGALQLAVVESNSDRTLRATARWDDDSLPDVPVKELLGTGGVCVITLDPKQGEAWQGIVALEGDSLAPMLEHYMARSEQIDTRMILAANHETAAGLLLQRLPDGHGDPDSWAHVVTLANTLKAEELLMLDAPTLLHRLYHEEAVRLFDAEPMAFACTCCRERVGDMLRMLGGQEVGEIIDEQGSVEIACEFCNQKYVFDDEDARELFDFDVVAAVREARH